MRYSWNVCRFRATFATAFTSMTGKPQLVAKVAETFEPIHHGKTARKTRNALLYEFGYGHVPVASLILATLLFNSPLSAEDPHLQRNPVFSILLKEGIQSLSADATYELPAPKFNDEQNATEQELVLLELLSDDLRPRFFRDSVVAPHVIKLGEQAEPAGGHVRYADFLFAVYADLDEVMEVDLWERLGQSAAADDADENRGSDSSDSTQGHVLTTEELAIRQITPLDEDDRREAYAFGENRVLKRVDIAATSRTCWSKTERSVVAAFIVDARFQDDAQYANRWWPLVRNDAGDLSRGKPHPYRGSGGYIRLTRLIEPVGCLIAEGHVAFAEPDGWFGGANLLASKLPTIVQSEIRRIRKLLK